jgi:hypothetical protein
VACPALAPQHDLQREPRRAGAEVHAHDLRRRGFDDDVLAMQLAVRTRDEDAILADEKLDLPFLRGQVPPSSCGLPWASSG